MSTTRAFAATLILLGAVVPGRASAYCLMTTSTDMPTVTNPCVTAGQPLHWVRSCISYSVDTRNLSPSFVDSASAFQGAVATSFDTWLAVQCGGAAVGFSVMETSEASLCDAAQFRSHQGNVNTISFVADRTDWLNRDYGPNAYAVTTVWHNPDTGEIYDADLLINASLGPFEVCPATGCTTLPCDQIPQSTHVDVQSVLTHEIGHFFGMGHSTVATATMYPTDCRGYTLKRDLDPDDVDGFCANYPAGSLPSACDYTPYGGLDVQCTYGVDTTSSKHGGRCSLAPEAPPSGFEALVMLLGIGVLVMRRRGRSRSEARGERRSGSEPKLKRPETSGFGSSRWS